MTKQDRKDSSENRERSTSRKRSRTDLSDTSSDKVNPKRRRIDSVITKLDINMSLDQSLPVKVTTLNNIYVNILESTEKSFDTYTNLYRNEQMDTDKLLKNHNELYELGLNHSYGVLPEKYEDIQKTDLPQEVKDELDTLLSSDDETVEDVYEEDDDDSDYEPPNDKERMLMMADNLMKDYIRVFEEKPEEESSERYSKLIKSSKLSPLEKDKLYEELKKVEEIRANMVPDRLKILGMDIPTVVKFEILEKLDMLDNQPHDDMKTRQWIKDVLKIPFGKYSVKPVSKGSKIEDVEDFLSGLHENLNGTTYGQEKIKETLLEIMAKWTTTTGNKGHCIALSGPPGVGKTTIVRSLAKSLNRPFCSFSLAGVSDESYLTGFPFTYEGATCGRIAKMIMDTGCMNPIIFMDELDKVDTKKSYSIFNKLIELTDFTQNHEIEDHYFGSNIKLDLSQCIFVFSLNHIENVDPILKNRLEVVEIKGYEPKEKITIAADYLIPRISKTFESESYTFEEPEIKYLISQIKSEPGVRNLERAIEQLFRRLNVLKYYKGTSYNTKHTTKITKKLIDKILKDKKHKVPAHILQMYS